MDVLIFILQNNLFVSEGYSSFGQIIRRHLNSNLIAKKDVDKILPHLSGNMCEYDVTVRQFYLKHCVRERFDDNPVLLDCCLF